jgi:hypothetical protein
MIWARWGAERRVGHLKNEQPSQGKVELNGRKEGEESDLEGRKNATFVSL